MKKSFLRWFPFRKKDNSGFRNMGRRDNIVLVKQDQNIVITIVPTSFKDHFYVMIESMQLNIIELIGVMKSEEVKKLLNNNKSAEHLIESSKWIQVLNLVPQPHD